MSVPTKMLRINAIEIIILNQKPSRFIGPRSQLEKIIASLNENNFKKVTQTDIDVVPWEILASSRIERTGKPGLALRGARIKEGLTQSELGKKLGVSQYNVSKMEKGNRAIGIKMALRIGKALKINYKVFL